MSARWFTRPSLLALLQVGLCRTAAAASILVMRIELGPNLIVRFSLSALVLLGLAACGDDPESGARGGEASSRSLESVTACSLLTAAQIEAATGRAPAEGEDRSQVGGRLPICNWAPADGESFDTLVSVLVAVSGYDNYAEFLESARESPVGAAFSEDAVEEVGGVGDFGVWMRETSMLQVYSDDRMVQVTVAPAAGRDPLEAARELGGAALERVR